MPGEDTEPPHRFVTGDTHTSPWGTHIPVGHTSLLDTSPLGTGCGGQPRGGGLFFSSPPGLRSLPGRQLGAQPRTKLLYKSRGGPGGLCRASSSSPSRLARPCRKGPPALPGSSSGLPLLAHTHTGTHTCRCVLHPHAATSQARRQRHRWCLACPHALAHACAQSTWAGSSPLGT